MSEVTSDAAPLTAVAPGAGTGAAPAGRARRRSDFLHYALRNPKLIFGLSLELLFVLAAIIGPMISPHDPNTIYATHLAPSHAYWLGTDQLGHDVFAQLVNGLRTSYLVGALGAICAAIVGMILGFLAGWRGGLLDEVLQLVTNIIIMIPALVLLIVIGAYLKTRGLLFEGVFIGLTTWPWVARAVRAQTFTLKSRDFVDLARLSGRRSVRIVIEEIAPNMASYLFLVVVLLFGSSMLLAASYDFLGLGPTDVVSLGTMMDTANNWSALLLHAWWSFIPPGVALTAVVGALLIANVGLDEVFNPKLREQ
ncbi:MAG TPA: ABC transporter permease [Streptosporangiaceae bacterium]|jgi:peptide/nickel transport system permease protein